LNPTAGSRAGAKGLWQFMYGTGKLYGLDQNSMVDDRFDPYKATEAAGRHLLDLYAIYGDWNLVLAAYNSGPGNVNKAIKRAGGLKNYWAIWPYLPRETRGYVPAFIAVNYVFNYAAEHNIFPVDPGILYHQIDSVSVRDVLSFDQIAEYMNIPIEQIEFLNPAYKVGIIPSLNEKNYVLRLPRKYITYFIEHEDSLYAFKSEKGMEHQNLMSKIKEAKQRTVHIVRKGENLGSIAHKYNTSVARLQSWNGLRNSQIFPGQKLIVYSPGISAPLSTNSVQSSAETKSYHQVQQGENLGTIAKKYGITIENLRKWNNMNDSLIHPGQKLLLKPNREEENSSVQKTETKTAETKTGIHTVKNGDTLWDIAKKYKTSVDRIKSLNHLGSSSKLKLGQKLKIPLSS
jgi:membrane-bound lytic murein transglycosylase D